jgi:hypothetical protein
VPPRRSLDHHRAEQSPRPQPFHRVRAATNVAPLTDPPGRAPRALSDIPTSRRRTSHPRVKVRSARRYRDLEPFGHVGGSRLRDDLGARFGTRV